MLFTSTPSCPLAILVYLCKLLSSNYVLPTHSPLSAQNSTTLLPLSFSPVTPKAHHAGSSPFPIHSFRSPRMHNVLSIIYSIQKPVHIVPETVPFFISQHTQPLTLENFNLIRGVLELTNPKSITALCHTSFNRMAIPSLALS